MAIILNNKPDLIDDDNRKFVGLELPLKLSNGREGYFQSTSLSINAIKENLRLLLNTKKGERLFQPNLGLNLRQMLFEQITEESIIGIQDSILDTFSFWLPFVEVRDIEILTNDNNKTILSNEIRVKILFNIIQDPNTLDSVTLTFQNE